MPAGCRMEHTKRRTTNRLRARVTVVEALIQRRRMTNQPTSTALMVAASSAVHQRQDLNKQLVRKKRIHDTDFQKVFGKMSEQKRQRKFSFENSGLRELLLYFNWNRRRTARNGHKASALTVLCVFLRRLVQPGCWEEHEELFGRPQAVLSELVGEGLGHLMV